MQKILIVFIFSFCLLFSSVTQVKEPDFAGKFYPQENIELSQTIKDFLKKAFINFNNRPLWAIVVPHAAYQFSGQIAAYGYKALEGQKYDTVVVLAPCHNDSFKYIAVCPQGEFKTPLGNIPIDEEAVKILMEKAGAKAELKPFNKEHSLEVQLPFLQSVLQDFKLAPVMIGMVSLSQTEKLAEVLLELSKNKKILIVVSTDLSHYKPARENDAVDQNTISYLHNNDSIGLYQAVYRQEAELCGLWPMITLMQMADKQKSEIVILQHSNSGYTSGEYHKVVGYLAAAYYMDDKESTMNTGFAFTQEEKKSLLKLAKNTIEAKLKKKPLPSVDLGFEKARQPGAAFVTLHYKGQLRGCIGHIKAVKPLAETVRAMAISAAFEDPRFYPVQEKEIKDIDIEISVLSPMVPLMDINELIIGKHGLFIVDGFNSGLLLPQVAVEQNWTREQFLSGVCQKAGLASDAWQKGAMLYTFTAEIFNENITVK